MIVARWDEGGDGEGWGRKGVEVGRRRRRYRIGFVLFIRRVSLCVFGFFEGGGMEGFWWIV